MGAIVTGRPDARRGRAASELASEPAIAAALEWFKAQRKWTNEKHVELCRIPAPTFQEQRRAEWMLAQFKAMGCEARIDRAGNVVAFPAGQPAGQLVAITAHLDTVLEPRAGDDIRAGRDGEMRGPGVSDNGAGLAALLAIGQAIRSSAALLAAPVPVALVANVCEEGEGNLSGMRFLCRPNGLSQRMAACLVLDGPSVEHVTSRALASRRFEIAVTGPGGHSWSDHGAANAVHTLSRAIAWFTDTASLQFAGGPRSSFNVGLFEGGTSINSIPASARAKVDLRSESPRRIDELAALLTAAVERAIEIENDRATSGRASAKIREIGSRPGGHLPEEAPILEVLRGVDQYLGIRSYPDCSSTDANIPLSLGIPAVSIGAGGQGGGAHTPSEWYHPEGRELGLRRIFLALCLLMRAIDPRAAGG